MFLYKKLLKNKAFLNFNALPSGSLTLRLARLTQKMYFGLKISTANYFENLRASTPTPILVKQPHRISVNYLANE